MCNAIKENLDTNLESEPEKKEFNYDEFFKDKEFHLPQSKHERPSKEITLLSSRITDDKGKSWGIERYEYKTCIEPNCGYPLVAIDALRGERVCEGCGLTNKHQVMIADMDLKQQHSEEPLRTSEDAGDITHDEEKVLTHIKKRAKKKEYTTKVREAELENRNCKLQVKTPMQDWRKKQYILTLGTISSQLLMTRDQKKRVKHIINKHSLVQIHSRVDQKTTIAGICRYILMKDGRGKELRFNQSVFKFVGLNESNYNVIKRNLDRLRVF
ncbi:TFIIB-type zinc ribbon-containing protein [Methanobacterium spitsbergense]|uniref:TFIIB-type zinc ribbon-containing protein n=1 Tax=Methanobacterium spitsbergense TaxID=2874285 RepID=A0A8T5URE4_9EURY|nr:TFIIB-type zinc ribbon-containing protein [Methanobacterium spitsbergense]MBZ2166338.1 TFIIB-type zinc ribbon-containing protein [Methanobacterium spitsbergense]